MSTATFTCPQCKSNEVEVWGQNRKQADSKARWAESQGWICEECTKAEQAQISAQAAEQNANEGLPVLVGTEKQVQWAETIRRAKLDQLAALIAGEQVSGVHPLTENDKANPLFEPTVDTLRGQDSASWWIDHKGYGVDVLLVQIARTVQPQRASVTERMEAEVMAEATVYPESPVTDSVTVITLDSGLISAVLPAKRDDFRETVKELGYRWTGQAWRRRIGRLAGDPLDRAAELGHALLAAGFPVRILDNAIRERAISGEYTPEHTRWITERTKGAYVGWYAVLWQRPDDLYTAARAITGSRYDGDYVVVPPEQVDEVVDFAAMYDFRIDDRAQAIMDMQREIKHQALRVSVTHADRQPVTSRKAGKLDADAVAEGVSDELRDEH